MTQQNGEPGRQQNSSPGPITKGKIKSDELQGILQSYSSDYANKKRGNQLKGVILGIGGILLSLGATIFGILGQSDMSAIFAACAASTQALLFAYPVEKRASLYRLLRIECSSLEEEIKVTDEPTQEQLQYIFDTFQAIKIKAADEDSETTLAEAADYYEAQLEKKHN